MKLFNTLSQIKEPFEPRGDEATIYVCGITPYDTTHIGHAFTYASMDHLIRYLELRGLKVRYVQNVTDIDDDILKRAREVGEDWRSLGKRWTEYFVQDMIDLNIRPPDEYPLATAMVEEIVRAVKELLKKGVAYEAGGNVYYSVDAWPEFGKLSNLRKETMLPIANERGNHPDDPLKHDPLDFVLWQAQAEGEPAWPSPWGPGRPGWHIECSTMVEKYLGKTIDFHGGGADLCFPHHECEIAQMEPVTGKKPFARFWLHTAMVKYEGEKMSKSLGNLVMVRKLLETYPADALRLYLASNHYRTPWTFKESELGKYTKMADKLASAASNMGGGGVSLEAEPAIAAFTQQMEDDLDTPAALKTIESLADQIEEAVLARRDVEEARRALRSFCSVFGLRLNQQTPQESVINGWNRHLQRLQVI